MPNAREELLQHVDPLTYYGHEFPEWSKEETDLVSCPRAENHEGGDDSTPSLSLSTTGKFFCQGCSWHGTSIVGFHTDVHHGGNYQAALADLYSRYVRKLVSPASLRPYWRAMRDSVDIRRRVLSSRGWTSTTLRKFKIGWCSTRQRTVIPIYNQDGLILDVRYHDSIKTARRKDGRRISMLAPTGGRTGDWFPRNPSHDPFRDSEDCVWLLEGEPDCLLAVQEGLNAATLTGGAKAWNTVGSRWFDCLKSKDVVISFDTDRAGENAAQAVAAGLAAVEVRSVKAAPVPMGKDLTEYLLLHGGSIDALKRHAATADYIIKPRQKAVVDAALAETSSPQYLGQQVRTRILVNGKGQAPVMVPRTLDVQCLEDGPCSNCPMSQHGKYEHHVLADDPWILEWIHARDPETRLKTELRVGKCKMRVDVLEWQSIEAIRMIPALATKESSHKYVARQGYYIGHGLEPNKTYEAVATPTIHPKSKQSVLLVNQVKNSSDDISSYTLSDAQIEHLRGIFRDPPKTIIKDIAHVLAQNHTRIYGRWAAHAAVDLGFHSPSSIVFNNSAIPKGSLELVLFGDTRCGKGQITEGLVRLYDLGCVVSGENASFMGLVGGAQKTDGGFDLVWGRIPTNTGRLVVIDEFSGYGDMGKMSRIRSEGVAELDKGGIHASTAANTRLIWLANPRGGRAMASFSSGVEALEDLVGAAEDIARFDLAIAVGKGEVSLDLINSATHEEVTTQYTPQILRQVVLWAWSRTSDQVQFTEDAVASVLKAASWLADRYSSNIPLIQGENIRFKLAKLAAAVAARCFSTPDGHALRVGKEHVATAVSFVDMCYRSPTLGYLDYSNVEKAGRDLKDVTKLTDFFKMWPTEVRNIMIDGMLRAEQISIRELQDWCNTDGNVAKKHIGLMVRCQALTKAHQVGGGYVKSPAFITLLRTMK